MDNLIQHRAGLITAKKSKGHGLPDEYQEVTWIESTGTEYIITDVLPARNLSFRCKFRTYSGSSPGYGNVFGSRENSEHKEYQMSLYMFGTVSVGARNTRLGMNLSEDNIVSFDGDSTVTVNGVKKTITTGTSFHTEPIALFCTINWKAAVQLAATRIYYLTFGDVADFIPCYRKSDGEIGMYDLVSKTFYTNQGTGTFLKGADV